MARYRFRRANGRRRSSTGGSTYQRANSESVSVLRLYLNDSLPGTGASVEEINWSQILQTAGLVNNAGTALRSFKARLIAVGWAARDSYSGGDVSYNTCSLEFPYSGSTFSISPRAVKTVRTRVPDKDYVANQWVSIATGSNSGVIGTIGNLTLSDNVIVAQSNAAVQFVDITIRY